MATICDLCKRSCRFGDTTELRDIYKIDGVSDVCSECRIAADAELNRLRNQIAPMMQKWVWIKAQQQQPGQSPGEPVRRPWWRRIFLKDAT